MKVIGHRGASECHPENTLAAFQAAWACGADGVELDIRLSRDGEVVVMHDASLLRTAGLAAMVSDRTWAELAGLDAGRWKGDAFAGEKIPCLRDVLAVAPSGSELFVELKEGAPLLDALASMDLPECVRLLTFDLGLACQLRENFPTISVWLNVILDSPEQTELVIEDAERSGLSGINVRWPGRGHAAWLEPFSEVDLPLYLWGSIPRADLELLSSLGVEGVMVDDPAAFLESLS